MRDRRSPSVAAATALALLLASGPAVAGGREVPTRDVSPFLKVRVDAHEAGVRLRGRAAEMFGRKAKVDGDALGKAASDQPERLTPDRGKPKIAQYDDPSFFGEKDEQPTRVPALAWRERGYLLDRLEPANATFLSGKSGRIKAARFINRSHRTDADFRYAYGKRSFEAYMQADDRLASIPRGQLADHLNVDLLAELSRISLVEADAPLRDRLLFALHGLEPGPDKAGVLRQAERRLLLTDPSDAELAVLKDRGIAYHLLPKRKGRIGYAVLVDHTEVMPRLERLISDTQDALRNPDSDPIQTAAHFVQEFIAIHPFLDGNGRLSRLVMDAILRDRGILPPILADTGRDLTLTEPQMIAEIEAGVVRTAKELGASVPTKTVGPDGQEVWAPPSEYELTAQPYGDSLSGFAAKQFEQAGATLPELGPKQPALVRIGASRFLQGADGFAYDLGGRPYLVNRNGELEPLTQLGYFSLVRRIARGPEPGATLDKFTLATRELMAKLATDPAGASYARVSSDLAAIRADNRYRLTLPDLPAADLLARYDLAKLEPKTLFGDGASHGPTYLMSRWQQLDLELWHVQGAFTARGDRASADAIFAQRAALFDGAKAYLGERAKQAGTATEANPFGLGKTFERAQFELSPLAAGSLAEHIQAHGDDEMIVFRGDLPITRYTGVFPDNIPLRGGAKQAARKLDARDSVFSLVGDLRRVEGSNVNSGYQSFTSDLALLTSEYGFGGRSKQLRVNLNPLPKVVRDLIVRELPDGKAIGVRNLRGLLRVALGRAPPEPAGQLDVTHVDAAQLRAIIAATYLSPTPAQGDQPARSTDELKAALTARVDEAYAAQPDFVHRLFGIAPSRTLRIDDLVGENNLGTLTETVLTRANLVVLKRDGDTGLVVTTRNRAHAIRIAKRDALPGIDALGGGFDGEQEIHVINRVLPTRVLNVWTTPQLNEPLVPATMPATVTTPAVTPAATIADPVVTPLAAAAGEPKG